MRKVKIIEAKTQQKLKPEIWKTFLSYRQMQDWNNETKTQDSTKQGITQMWTQNNDSSQTIVWKNMHIS